MKSRPILFSAPMVRAILDGTKTQTRRLVKPEHLRTSFESVDSVLSRLSPSLMECAVTLCPYGQPGDRLWVKETARLNVGSEENVIQYRADMAIAEIQEDWFSDDPVLRRWIWGQAIKPEGWRPSILMPRRASRINLEVTGIRVERLKDIDAHDALAEGVGHNGMGNPLVDYQNLWEKINGPGSWAANPWVWVISFQNH